MNDLNKSIWEETIPSSPSDFPCYMYEDEELAPTTPFALRKCIKTAGGVAGGVLLIASAASSLEERYELDNAHLVPVGGGVQYVISDNLEGAIEVSTNEEKINRIQDELGLTISSFARVMHVQRPVVYSWLKGGGIKEENRDRLNKIYKAVSAWSDVLGTKLGAYLHSDQFTPNGESLYDLLEKDEIDEEELLNGVARLSEGRKSALDTMTELDELAREHGFVDKPEYDV